MKTFPHTSLSSWFKKQKRSLPWRETSDPYAIWVSEVMLQQTQVKTVIPYFLRWMKRFPTLKDLATADTEEVIKLWEGLGYYSRARNLQKGAQQILKDFQGIFPQDDQKLLSIKGIGPYTKGAIQSFAFKMKSSLVDGNVKRVISRFFAIEKDFSVPKNHRQLEQLMQSLLPDYEPWIFNEALMELGALICSPKQAQCSACPLHTSCLAHQNNLVDRLPLKVQRAKRVLLNRLVLIYYCNGRYLVEKKTKGVMQDLYEFPYLELKSPKSLSSSLDAYLDSQQIEVKEVLWLQSVTHGFTHHHVTLYPVWISIYKPTTPLETSWLSEEELKTKPFSSGHRKVLSFLTKKETQLPSVF